MPVPDPTLARHLEELRLLGQSEGSIYARCRAILRMAELIATPLLEATEEDLAAWRARLAATVTDNTVVHYASHARQFFRWTVESGLRDDNPAARLLVPPLARGLPRPIGEESLSLAISGAEGWLRAALVLAACAGLRAKEIAYLRRERVLDTKRPPVLLIARDATKGRHERIVEMSSFVVEELRAYGLPRAGWVFRRRDGKPGPNRPSRVSQAANAYLHSLGISETLHQLRHRFGTELYAVSSDIRLVQEKLGHARVDSTAGYTQYSNARAAEAIEALAIPGQLRPVTERAC